MAETLAASFEAGGRAEVGPRHDVASALSEASRSLRCTRPASAPRSPASPWRAARSRRRASLPPAELDECRVDQTPLVMALLVPWIRKEDEDFVERRVRQCAVVSTSTASWQIDAQIGELPAGRAATAGRRRRDAPRFRGSRSRGWAFASAPMTSPAPKPISRHRRRRAGAEHRIQSPSDLRRNRGQTPAKARSVRAPAPRVTRPARKTKLRMRRCACMVAKSCLI